MDPAAIYSTFTHPKVVTSMLLVGIGLGLALSTLVFFFTGTWFLPVTSAAVVLGTVIIYMIWLDRQDFREPDVIPLQEPEHGQVPVLIRAEYPSLSVDDAPSRYALFTDFRVIRSMLVLAIGLGLAVCIAIILFRGTWFLPALIAALTVGTVAGYLCWLDGLTPDRDQGPSSP